ncbi:hypothetical protein [Actinotalea sp. Marseille-Q4924]|uniref:hypothetical protein n=1 Tax=Actinotalea sp. Marseille-Q4924 TaxID=2866571 RepID=UPI001CE3CDC3|nr:hypothetical protein [Actinotalea sp. Marseille-Q4924]
MNTVLHPVGPQPARVYWVRRLILLALVVGIVAALAVAAGASRGGAVTGPPPGDAAAQAAADVVADEDGTAEDEPATEPEPEPDAAAACSPESLTTTLVADAATYPAGATPTFTVTLTNVSDSACTVDAGAANQSLVITSGPDRIWSSTDCPEAEGERLLLMAPAAAEAMPVAWPRVRSDEACTGGLPEPRAGTYTAVAVVAGVQSAPIVFDLG